jgi:hypothetical protein
VRLEAQRFQAVAQRGERVAQLVREDGEELVLAPVGSRSAAAMRSLSPT